MIFIASLVLLLTKTTCCTRTETDAAEQIRSCQSSVAKDCPSFINCQDTFFYQIHI